MPRSIPRTSRAIPRAPHVPGGRRAGSVRWFVLAFLALLMLGAGGAMWLRHSNFEDPVYTPIPAAKAAVSGRVLDRNGAPVAGLSLAWFRAEGEAQGGLVLGGRMFVARGEAAVTAADGAFRFEGLDPAIGFVAVSSDDHLREGRTGQFEARAGYDAGALELRVEDVAHERRAHLRLAYPDGTPATHLAVRGESQSWRGSWSAVRNSGASGEVEFVSPWKGGTFVLEVTGPDGTKTTIEDIPVGEGTVDQTVHR